MREIGFPTSGEKEYIPENIFYREYGCLKNRRHNMNWIAKNTVHVTLDSREVAEMVEKEHKNLLWISAITSK
jgi:hypothetical protein